MELTAHKPGLSRSPDSLQCSAASDVGMKPALAERRSGRSTGARARHKALGIMHYTSNAMYLMEVVARGIDTCGDIDASRETARRGELETNKR